ncbi:MAG: hypothetical protein EVA65_16450 [Oceanococcus sp.]|nr:MAG: hypothetical protein EVA65_16450 [Oceanococcus sp.]
MQESEYISECITRANRGDADAADELLRLAMHCIDKREPNWDVLDYFAQGIDQYIHKGIPIDRALGTERFRVRGKKYNPVEVAACFHLLNKFAGFGIEKSNEKLGALYGIDRRHAQRIIKEHSPMGSLDRELLLHLSGDMREKVWSLLPHK